MKTKTFNHIAAVALLLCSFQGAAAAPSTPESDAIEKYMFDLSPSVKSILKSVYEDLRQHCADDFFGQCDRPGKYGWLHHWFWDHIEESAPPGNVIQAPIDNSKKETPYRVCLTWSNSDSKVTAYTYLVSSDKKRVILEVGAVAWRSSDQFYNNKLIKDGVVFNPLNPVAYYLADEKQYIDEYALKYKEFGNIPARFESNNVGLIKALLNRKLAPEEQMAVEGITFSAVTDKGLPVTILAERTYPRFRTTPTFTFSPNNFKNYGEYAECRYFEIDKGQN